MVTIKNDLKNNNNHSLGQYCKVFDCMKYVLKSFNRTLNTKLIIFIE